jgi:hypothetical protein
MMPAEPVPPAAAGTRVLTCPSCGGSIKIRANGISITAICGSCGSVLDVANPDVRLIAEVQSRTRDLAIPLGMRGTLAGAEWEVVGVQNRSDAAEGWSWDEYLLFNPYLGFRFLVQDDADWVLYCTLREDVPDPEAGFGGRRFALDHTGTAHTDNVMGEFYWRARVGDEVSVAEYSDGPNLLSREQNNEEIIWSRGVRLSDQDLRPAFGLPPVSGALSGAADAPPGQSRRSGVMRVGAIAVLALFLAHMIPFGTNRSAVVFTRTFHTTAADQGRTLTTDAFQVPGTGGNLLVTASSQVRNNWVELDLSLVGPNDITFFAAPSIEYYYGEDSDGPWSEGAQSTDVSFAAVPGGSYRVLIDPYAGVYETDLARQQAAGRALTPVDFTVTVTRHVPSWPNFMFALLLLVPYPIFRFFRDRASRGRPSRLTAPETRK